VNLHSLSQRLEARRRRIVGALKGKPVAHFIHVGKTGGTAMKATLRAAPDDGAYTLFVHGHAQTLRHVPVGEKVVFFLREPLSKFASGFNYRQRQALPMFNIPWRPEETAAFAHFTTPNQLARSLSAEDAETSAKARAAMCGIHQVKDSVFRWFESEAYFLSRLDDILFIGFQEQLDADFEILKQRLGLPSKLLLPGSADPLYQQAPSPAEPLDQIAVANLTDWYAADLRFYALCRKLREQGSVTGHAVRRLKSRRTPPSSTRGGAGARRRQPSPTD